MKRVLAAILIVAASAGIAVADEATARKSFDDGERAYNLGDFAKAVDLFKQAYDQWPEPAFLFNVAQTYRQMGDCKQALFFYKRFIALKEQDTKKPLRPQLKEEVEKRIGELEECMKRELAAKPPQELDNGGTGTGTTGTTGTAGTGPTTATGPDTTTGPTVDHDTGPDGGEPTSTTPSMLSVRALAGAAKLSAGELDTKLQFTAGVLGGYPLAINDKLTLELGAAFDFTPVPYTTGDSMEGSGSLIAILANVGPSYEVMPKLAVRADVGLGVLLFGGLSKEMNPFTEGGASASGALTVFHLRTALSVDYAVTPNIVVTATPIAFAYSPAPDGFDPSISSLTTLSFMAGVGYRR
jgi:tetratricopeptide (TPR) repeat protein